MQPAELKRWVGMAIAAVVLFDVVAMAVIGDVDRARPRAAQESADVERTVETMPFPTSTLPLPEPGLSPMAPPDLPAMSPPPDPGPYRSGRGPYTGPITSIAGRVLDGDGRPVRGAEVAISENTGFIEGFARVFVTVLSFGFYCREPSPVDCRDSGRATTGPDGRYTIRLLAGIEEVKQAGDFNLVAQEGGRTTQLRLETIPSERFAAPDLKLWSADLRISGGRATWRRPPDEARQVLEFVENGNVELSRQGDGSIDFEPRVLEDMDGFAELRAESGAMRWTPPRLAYRGPGAPPSRNRPCTIAAEKPEQPATRHDRCPLTDKDDTRLTGRHGKELVIDLGTRRTVILAVVRAFPGGFAVDVSMDGSVWTPAMNHDGRGSSDMKLAYAATPQEGRYVRVRIEDWDFWFMERISIW